MEVAELSELLDPRDIKAERSCAFDDTESEDPMIVNFNSDSALGMITESTEMLPPLTGFEDDEDTVHSNDSTEDVIVQLMDIRTNLSTLRNMLERRLGTDLTQYTFWLQDAKELESHKTLVDQCIKGEGVVQVNIQLRPQERRINILDVLKPDEELVDFAPSLAENQICPEEACPELDQNDQDVMEAAVEETTVEEDVPLHSTMAKWVVDEQFQADRARLKMPEEPSEWSLAHVRLWIQWAVRQFNLIGVKLSNWTMNGEQLCAMTLPEFKEKCPHDPGDIFWTHLELLRKCKFIAVVQKDQSGASEVAEQAPVVKRQAPTIVMGRGKGGMKRRKTLPVTTVMSDEVRSPGAAGAGGSGGGGGQVHLWQFLLELLTTADHLPVIQWQGTEGEFKLCDPERVARLWGARKHKPAMNYEKLSRALRYYYDGDMIAKVNGKRFVYKFVCDLRQLVGYSAAELSRLVTETYEENCRQNEWPSDLKD